MESELELPDVRLVFLTPRLDARGFFREVARASGATCTEGFAQWSHAKLLPGVIKAWHLHHRQVDWWYCPIGTLQVALWDQREGSPAYGQVIELILGEDDGGRLLRIPPGVAHGCKALGAGPSHLFYLTSREYDGSDEGRIPFDAAPYDWLRPPPIT